MQVTATRNEGLGAHPQWGPSAPVKNSITMPAKMSADAMTELPKKMAMHGPMRRSLMSQASLRLLPRSRANATRLKIRVKLLRPKRSKITRSGMPRFTVNQLPDSLDQAAGGFSWGVVMNSF